MMFYFGFLEAAIKRNWYRLCLVGDVEREMRGMDLF